MPLSDGPLPRRPRTRPAPGLCTAIPISLPWERWWSGSVAASLDAYCARKIFTPLRMTRTRFLPPASWRRKIAPTEYDEQGKMLRGVVHDPRARRMGGVAGHAGLFSTADDLSKFAQALLEWQPGAVQGDGREDDHAAAATNRPVLRGFGWDIDSPFSSNRGGLLARGFVRAYRVYRYIDVDRSNYPHFHHSADQLRPSAREGKRGGAAFEGRDGCGCGDSRSRSAKKMNCAGKALPVTTRHRRRPAGWPHAMERCKPGSMFWRRTTSSRFGYPGVKRKSEC